DRVVVASHQHGITVGSSRRGGFRGEDSAGSGTVLDDELLFQPASQLVRQNAHPDICDATGPIGNDELHRAIRIIGLGAGGHNHHDCREKRTGDERLAQQADWPTQDGDGGAFDHPTSPIISNDIPLMASRCWLVARPSGHCSRGSWSSSMLYRTLASGC